MTMKIERNADGKLIINENTSEKQFNRFYRQKDGSLYFDLEAGGDIVEGLKICLEAAKQEHSRVNYSTCRADVVTITPEMSRADAVNAFLCGEYIKKGEKMMSENETNKKRAKQILAEADSPTAISLYEFGLAHQGHTSTIQKIFNFCKAHDIKPEALDMHYSMALNNMDMDDVVKHYDSAARIDSHIQSSYGIPYLIKESDLPQLKEKLVLSPKAPKVAVAKRERMQKAKSRDFQNE